MRKHLAVVGVVTISMATAAPASARLADPVPAGTRPAVTFAPGMSDAAQSGYKPHPVARVGAAAGPARGGRASGGGPAGPGPARGGRASGGGPAGPGADRARAGCRAGRHRAG